MKSNLKSRYCLIIAGYLNLYEFVDLENYYYEFNELYI